MSYDVTIREVTFLKGLLIFFTTHILLEAF